MASAGFCPNCFAEGAFEVCPHCDYIALSQAGSHLILPPGVLLQQRYLVGRALGAGGFGITYLVKDGQTGQLRAVKEYLPNTLAVRDAASLTVYPSSSANSETYQHGLSVFKREAQMLRAFSGNPSVVQVYDYFEANGTAYFVMEYLDGVNLKALSRSMGGKLSLALATEILQNMAQILDGVHQQGMLHRDVSPENIFVTKAGLTKLIDFGATRFFVGERSQSLSVILKPGFAPPEQYSSKGNQGPWTDLYALCATFYNVVCGQGLPDAPDRLSGEAVPPMHLLAPGIPPNVEAAVEKGLSLDWRLRQQSMAEFLAEVATSAAPPPPAAPLAVEDPGKLKGSPYIQAVRKDRPNDKWLIPKNMRMTIGRAAEQCNIVIDEPNVSRVHCTIQYDDKKGVFYLTDQSTNGTLVGEEKIGKGQTKILSPGETFYITTRANALKVGLE